MSRDLVHVFQWEYTELEIPEPTVPYIPPQSDCPGNVDGR